MKAVILMFDSLNRDYLSVYNGGRTETPNFDRLAKRSVKFTNCYAGSLPCMPARRDLHTGRYNFLHRSWGPLEPFDDSVFERLAHAGIHTHLVSDHYHYWEDGGAHSSSCARITDFCWKNTTGGRKLCSRFTTKWLTSRCSCRS